MQNIFVMGSDCNLNCSYCFEKHRNKSGIMKLSYINSYLDIVYGFDNPFNIDKNEPNVFYFTGGEPSLYSTMIADSIEKIKDKIKKMDYVKETIIIETNGYNIQGLIPILNKYQDIQVVFSVDGDKSTHDKVRGINTFDIVWKNYTELELKNKQLRWTLNANATHKYFEVVKDWLSSDKQFGVCINWADQEFKTKGWVEYSKQVDLLINWYKTMPLDWVLNHYYQVQSDNYRPKFLMDIVDIVECNGKRCTLDYDGTLIKCVENSKISVANRVEDYVFGNITEIENIRWKELTKDKLARDVFDLNDDECYGCPIGNNCNACPVTRNVRAGSPDGKIDYCCNIHAIRQLEKTFFHNYFIYAERQIKGYSNIQPMSILVPKVWALDVIKEETYNAIVNTTIEVGGGVTPLKTKFYSKEDIEAIKQQSTVEVG